ncbi:ATP-binding protein [Agromyces aurantiacus]|uniref:ATP-binding protein n=1 Tax=Agromyces aurantiacus TaxID=165814 RepID=A0ABV9R0N6_9MICO|nr:ATP-binding protein [Agromyces aurantiacus]MBM7505810.1 putative ATPase [Agromyces aurantiacus]
MSNWYVITGGPSSGKTTTVDLLARRGYRTAIEQSRHYIDLQRLGGRSVADIRSRQVEFQRNVLDLQLAQEAALDPDEIVFLDRGLPDSLAYYRFLGLEPDARLLEALAHLRYRKAFILSLLPLHPDYARTEDASAQRRIHDLLLEVYSELPIPLVEVPAVGPEERADYILSRL